MTTQKTHETQNQQEPVTFLRRLGAMLYDLFLLLTVLFVASFLVVIPTNIKPDDPYFFLFQVYIFFVAYLFFAWCWTRSGQTLGMRTWRMKVVNQDGTKLSYTTALIRFTVSIISWLPFGIGYLWSIWDKQHRTWHDIASNTKLVRT